MESSDNQIKSSDSALKDLKETENKNFITMRYLYQSKALLHSGTCKQVWVTKSQIIYLFLKKVIASSEIINLARCRIRGGGY